MATIDEVIQYRIRLRKIFLFVMVSVCLALMIWDIWVEGFGGAFFMGAIILTILFMFAGLPVIMDGMMAKLTPAAEQIQNRGFRWITNTIFRNVVAIVGIVIIAFAFEGISYLTRYKNYDGTWFYWNGWEYTSPSYISNSKSVKYHSSVILKPETKTFVININSEFYDSLYKVEKINNKWTSQDLKGTLLHPARIKWSNISDVFTVSTTDGKFVYYNSNNKWEKLPQNAKTKEECVNSRNILQKYMESGDNAQNYIFCR